jgi:predicted amidohydrolase YtcJ
LGLSPFERRPEPGRDGERSAGGFVLAGGLLFDAEAGARPGSLVVSGSTIAAVVDPGREGPADLPRLELRGRVLLPGFCDAHCHFLWAGLLRVRVDLSPAASRDEALALVAEALRRPDLPESILAEGWDEAHWPDGTALTGRDLDRVARDRPVVARRVCTHVAAANRAALRCFDGSDLATVDTERGLLYEDAAMLASRVLPGLAGERRRACAAAVDVALRNGIVEVHDPIGIDDLRLLVDAHREGELPIRVRGFLRFADLASLAPGELDGLREAQASVRLAGVKLFADGSIGARTAAVTRPYVDGGCGELLWAREDLTGAIAAAHARGLRCAIHAIGDRAVRLAVDCVEAAGAAGDRIEHLELVDPGDIERVAALGLVGSMQPNFVARWAGPGGLYERALGRDRARESNPFGSLRAAGVRLAFGSDCMPVGPLFGLRGALCHPDRKERLAPEDALAAYTDGGARSLGEPPRRIAPGAPADLCLLSARSIEADALDAAQVDGTWVGGRRVYERGSDRGGD